MTQISAEDMELLVKSVTARIGEEVAMRAGSITRATYFVHMKFSDGVVCEMKLGRKQVPGWPKEGHLLHLDGVYNSPITSVKYSDHEDQFAITLLPIQFNSPFDPGKFRGNIRKGWTVLRITGIGSQQLAERLSAEIGVDIGRISWTRQS